MGFFSSRFRLQRGEPRLVTTSEAVPQTRLTATLWGALFERALWSQLKSAPQRVAVKRVVKTRLPALMRATADGKQRSTEEHNQQGDLEVVGTTARNILGRLLSSALSPDAGCDQQAHDRATQSSQRPSKLGVITFEDHQAAASG